MMELPGARLWLVRHGQTDWNAVGRIQGHTPTDLNEAGRGQAELLATFFAGRKFSAAWTSDLPRAASTARIIVEGMGLALQQSDKLRERSFGEYEGCTSEQIHAKRNSLGIDQGSWSGDLADWTGIPGVENNEVLWERVAGALKEISVANAGGDVLVVTHGGVVARAVYRTLGIEDSKARRFPLSNGIVAVLQWRPAVEGFYLMSLLDVPLMMGHGAGVDTAMTGAKR